MTILATFAVFKKVQRHYDVAEYEENNISYVVYWFLGTIAVFLLMCIFYNNNFVTTNEHGLYMDRSGSIAFKACNMYKVKVWMYLHCPFYIKANSASLDEDYLTNLNPNKYQILRSTINNDVTKFFKVCSPIDPYNSSKQQELEDYRSTFNRFNGVPPEYLSPDIIINTFLKFLPHETFNELKKFAKKLNSRRYNLDLEKIQYLEEKCGICLDSLYLPKNEVTDKYEAKFSSIRLMCGHKFHFQCFINNTYRKWGSGAMELPENSVNTEGSFNNQTLFSQNTILYTNIEGSSEKLAPQHIDKKEALLKPHKQQLKIKLLENIQKQYQNTNEITTPIKNKNLKTKVTHISIYSSIPETFVEKDNIPNVQRPIKNTFQNTNKSIKYIDNKTVEEKELIEKTLNSRVDRKCHCALCRLDIELVVAYLKSKKLEVENCQII